MNEHFLAILRRPLDLCLCRSHPHLSDEDLRMSQWRVKQWIADIVYRLFQRYSNPIRLSHGLFCILDRSTMTIWRFFRRAFAAPFTEAMEVILSVDRRLISPRVANLAFLYLECAVTVDITYRVIKPKLTHLITHIIFPYLCMSNSDVALWVDDPVEYVRKTYDTLEDFNTARVAACSLRNVLSRARTSDVISLSAFFFDPDHGQVCGRPQALGENGRKQPCWPGDAQAACSAEGRTSSCPGDYSGGVCIGQS